MGRSTATKHWLDDYLADTTEDMTIGGSTTLKDVTTETDGVVDIFVIDLQSSGTPAAGLGAGISIKIEDAGGSEEQASIDVVMTTVTDGSEDADLVISLNSSGTITELLKLDGSTQLLQFSDATQWTANGSGTVTVGNVAPTGVGTATIGKWLTVQDNAGTAYYIPAWT